MRHELKRVEPLRAANVGALLYGILMAAFAVIALPFFLLASLVVASKRPGGAAPLSFILLIAFYPILGVVMGWVSGLLTAAIYNLIVRWSGGLLLELQACPVTSTGPDPA